MDWIGALAHGKSRRGIVVVHSRSCAAPRPGHRVVAIGSDADADVNANRKAARREAIERAETVGVGVSSSLRRGNRTGRGP